MAQPSTLRSNFRHLYFDIFWYGVLAGSTVAFISVYAARLGATSFQLGLLTAGPAVINLFLSLPAARWLENRNLIRTTFLTSVAQRILFFAFIPLPLLFNHANETWAIIVISLLIALPGTPLAISFNSMFAEVVPNQYRAEVVGRRNALSSVCMTATTYLCGWLLDRVVFPLNYQILFGIGAVGVAMSSYHLWRIKPLEGSLIPASPSPAIAAAKRSLLRGDVLRTPFGLLILAYILFYTSQNAPVPVNPLFWVKELHLTDGQIGAGNAIFYASMAISAIFLTRFTTRFGNHRVLVAGALAYAAYPFITALAGDYVLFWVASLLGGAIWGIGNGALVSRLMERVPANDRPAHMAWHNIALNFGILVGALVGATLAEWLGFRNALFILAAMRFLSGIAIFFWA
jgi:MFS family permease